MTDQLTLFLSDDLAFTFLPVRFLPLPLRGTDSDFL